MKNLAKKNLKIQNRHLKECKLPVVLSEQEIKIQQRIDNENKRIKELNKVK
jgi:hypothetical protein